jgi:hypothetical protein
MYRVPSAMRKLSNDTIICFASLNSHEMTAFWDIASCSLTEVDRRFRGAYCQHHQGDAA